MSGPAAQVLKEALRLSVDEQAKLASQLIASVDGQPDADAESAWATEVENRARRALAGVSQGTDWETVRSRVEAKLGSK